ncbi:DUF2637 domain-containing protein [Plantactinospora sp. KBS50]|uniref:DUF2637 domain-containing protein n=1 Tax=Plantactinospora sp. KBS50 TaxID=2024580 RepID=UPI000BAACC80|nr:DUF2637 domain-containing protein [Plantactinospora sp. KBS50]ASW55045.1 hypothetical protein CIK06_13930 [Plantactinospora sp. KBS50]
MALTTITSRAAAALVAAVAGFASYQHIYRVAITAGEHRSVSAVLPLAIDGLILVATLAMLDDKRNGRLPRMSARIALAFGILATLAANIASAQPTTVARMVAAVPAVSFMLAVEVLARSGKPIPAAAGQPATAVPSAAVPSTGPARQRSAASETVRPETVPPETAGPVPAPHGTDPAPAGRRRAAEPAATNGAPGYRPDVRPRPARGRGKAPTAAQKVASAAATLPEGTVAQIAAHAGVAESTARRHLAATPPVPIGVRRVGAVPARVANGHPVGAAAP